jgi:hypothetical protein
VTRTEPPLEGDERSMLVGWLDFHRETLAIKAGGLPPERFAARPISNSATSLLGLVRHLTEIERTYFRRVFAGEEVPDLPFGTDPFGEEPGSNFPSAALAPPEEALSAWRTEVEASRQVIAGAPSLDDRGASGLPLRFWLVKTLNEYARHNGHADVIRELIDGTTGE